MLGVDRELKFTQNNSELKVVLPDTLPCEHAVCLKIIPVLNPVPESLLKY
jgi:hypothetical protein